MFAISVRVRPCSDLCSFSSDGRDTMTSPFSILMARSGWNVFFNSPLGPFTVTVVPSAVTFTPLGTLTGILPILDIVRSPRLPDHGQENERCRESAKCRSDRKSTRLNSSHTVISYAVFCFKKKKDKKK